MRDRGSAAVEFALVVPLVLVVLLTVVEVAVAARAQLEVTQAAREAAREAATTPDPTRAVAAAHTMLGPSAASRARISVARDQRVGGLARVTIVVPHRVASPLFGGLVVELRATSTMRVER